MKAKLVCYALKANPVTRTMLHRELYGYKDSSNHGKYSYVRTGLLKKTQAKRITDAVILITETHAKELTNLLRKYGARTYVFDVVSNIKL
ncbi:MAG TPA: hypothetical protein VJC16_07040 [Candidatus Nanoarchaeia archaeon]|nr:hypothetical protein [Candidatus Nanoarchaeia archaeon]